MKGKRTMSRRMRVALGLLLGASLATPALAQMPGVTPAQVRDVRLEQRLNEVVPLALEFRDENGRTVHLGDYFGSKPVILTLVYYECPMLCTMVLNGTVRTLRTLSFTAGKEFEIVTVSIAPTETPVLAAEKKRLYLQQYGRPAAAAGWHFLTGDEDSIRQLADAVGFRYNYDPDTKLYAHASGLMVLTPEGRLARYFYGLEYPARDLRLALVEASHNRIGNPVDAVLLYCFHYDPTTGKYGLVIMRVLRLAGLATVLLLAGFVWISVRRERRTRANGQTQREPV